VRHRVEQHEHEREHDEAGQAATELALVLPLLVLLLLGIAQVVVLARDQILVVHAAREAAREAAVDPRPAAVRRAALRAGGEGLKPERLATEASHTGGAPVTVIVRLVYRAPTDVALVGPLLPDIEVRAKAAMRREVTGGLGESSVSVTYPAGTATVRGEPTGEGVGSAAPH
jgi:hypothetical protein